MYCLFCDVSCIVCVYMCTEQLPPGGYPIAVKYIISYHIWFQLITENLMSNVCLCCLIIELQNVKMQVHKLRRLFRLGTLA